MTLRINSEAPNFTAETTEGSIDFHQWIGDGWAILFSHPKDFTPVCTTELGYMARLKPEFEKRNCKVIGLSVDPVDDHRRWVGDIQETQGHAVNYPLIGDSDLAIAKAYDMLPEDAGDTARGRTAATNATVRSVFLIGPDKRIKAMLTYPMSTGRNFDELIRSLQQSLGLTVVMVTHDLDSLIAICDRVAVLTDKKIVVGTIAELLELDHPWIHEYFRGPRARAAFGS